MDAYLLIYNVLLTFILVYPSHSETCSCNSGDTITPTHCKVPSKYSVICYGSISKHTVCVNINCPSGTTFSATCGDKNSQHATWTPTLPSTCTSTTTSTTTSSTSSSSPTSSSMTTDASSSSSSIVDSTETTSSVSNNNTSTSTVSSGIITTPINNGSSETTTPSIDPTTTSSKPSFETDTSQSSTEIVSTSTDGFTPTSTEASPKTQKQKGGNIVLLVAAPLGAVVVVIVIIIVVIFLCRRNAHKDESNGIKRQPHGAISNNSYHNAAMNDNTIPMNDLSRTSSENRYTDIYDDKAMAIDTFDGNYNTVALPSESKNEYGNIKPAAEPFVDNTYSHISNPNHLDMGTMYSHIGSALGHQQAKQPEFAGDTYAHIGQGNGNATANGKNKQDTFASDDTYSHIGKDATVSKTTKKTAEVDDTYSHLDQNVNQHHKMPPNADVDATYNTLGSSTNGVGTQNRSNQIVDNDDDSEYNHLEFGMKSATKQNQFPRKQNNTKLPDKNTKQNTAASNLYAQVVKKKHGKFGVEAGSKATDKAKANTDNEQGQHIKFVVKDDDAKIAEETENEPTNHQYFVLEKHERET